jgi:hypothetical protein
LLGQTQTVSFICLVIGRDCIYLCHFSMSVSVVVAVVVTAAAVAVAVAVAVNSAVLVVAMMISHSAQRHSAKRHSP